MTHNYKNKTFFIVYRELQSTQLDRVISKSEVRKGREAGTIHRWFTGVVLLSCLPAIIVWVVCLLGGWRELWSVDCAQCCGFCICWRWFEPLPLRTGYLSHCARFGWRRTGGTADCSEHFWLECLEDFVVGWLKIKHDDEQSSNRLQTCVSVC